MDAAAQILKTTVSAEMKAAVRTLAARELLTESVWLRRVVHAALQPGEAASPKASPCLAERKCATRLSVRLPPEDRRLLHERARARCMPAATYVSVLVRAHLRDLTPLPKDELMALKRSVAELGAIGRNINQIAQAANKGAVITAPAAADLKTFLKVCTGLRDHVKALIKANTHSWEHGDAKANH